MTFCLLALLMKPYNTLCKLMSCQLLKKKIQTMLVTLILVKYVLLNLTGWLCDVLFTQGSVCYLHCWGPEEVGCCCVVQRCLAWRDVFHRLGLEDVDEKLRYCYLMEHEYCYFVGDLYTASNETWIKSPGESVVVEASNTRMDKIFFPGLSAYICCTKLVS